MPDTPSVDLTLVFPVYNEEAGIAIVLEDWHASLESLGVTFEIRAYDDGSTDGSHECLRALEGRLPHLVVEHHSNRGHGPTILRGYREARGRYVAQCDSDGEFQASCFERLWCRREDAVLVVGRRVGRRQIWARRTVSAVSRGATRLLFGRGVRGLDVNSPLRLMRRRWLRAALAVLDADTFAPNVLLTGFAARDGGVLQVEVECVGRQWGDDSLGSRPLGSWSLWRAAARALKQTVVASRRRPAMGEES